MPDIFDFISTRSEVKDKFFNIDVPPLSAPVLIPAVPSDFRTQDKNASLVEKIGYRISSLPLNRPAYAYTQKEENRYSNPNLQFTPYTTLGSDIEDIYGRNQGPATQLWNSLLKSGATAGSTFVSSFLSIPSTLDLLRSGKYVEAFEDDTMFSNVQNWLVGIEDKLPNYYTEWEREHPYLSSISPTGAANFWGDKVIKNIGFSIGALAAGLVQDAGIELLSGGLATPATFIALANQIRKVPSNLFRGFRALTKGSQVVNGIDDIINIAKSEKNLYKALTIPALQQVKTGSRFAAISYLSAQGESFIEGYHAYLDTKKTLLQQHIDTNLPLTSDVINEIEERAQHAGRWTTGLNLPLLTVSNLIQFPTLIYGKNALGKTIPFVKSQFTEEGLKLTNEYTFKKGLKTWATSSFRTSFSEGLEESAQYFISNSLHDYYVDRFNPNIKKGLLAYTLENADKILNDPLLYQEGFLGAVSGFLMGAPASIPNLSRGKLRYDTITNNLTNSYNRFNSSVKQFTSTIELDNVGAADKSIAAHKNLYSLVHDSLKYGTYDTFNDSLEDLKTKDLQSFNQAFNTKFQNSSDQLAFIDSLIQETLRIKQDVLNVEQFYPTNPYTKPYLLKKIQRAFTDKSIAEVENLQENLFSDFKEVVGYNQSLQRVTNGISALHQDALKSLGVKNEAISFLGTIAIPKGLFQYSRWKKEQIDTLTDRMLYYSEFDTLDIKTQEEKDKTQRELEKMKVFYSALNSLYEKLAKDPKNEELKKLINSLVLSEEVSEEQFGRYREDLIKTTENLQTTAAAQESLQQEEKDLTSEKSVTAEKIVDLNGEAEEIITPESVIALPPQPVSTSWIDSYSVGDVVYALNSPLTIIAKSPEGLIVTNESGEYLVQRAENKWKLIGRNTNLYQFGTVKNEIILDRLTQEDLDEITEDVLDVLKVSSSLTTPSEVFKSNNTYWILSDENLNSSSFIYSMENGIMVKRLLVDGSVSTTVYKTWESIDELPNFIDGFVQVLRGNELPISVKTTVENESTSIKNNIQVFMGNLYTNEDMIGIFERKINQGIFELNCT